MMKQYTIRARVATKATHHGITGWYNREELIIPVSATSDFNAKTEALLYLRDKFGEDGKLMGMSVTHETN